MGVDPDHTDWDGKEFYDFMTSPVIEVSNLLNPNDQVAWISWQYTLENIMSGGNAKDAITAYVTTSARLNLIHS
jgi:hypothetical protein